MAMNDLLLNVVLPLLVILFCAVLLGIVGWAGRRLYRGWQSSDERLSPERERELRRQSAVAEFEEHLRNQKTKGGRGAA